MYCGPTLALRTWTLPLQNITVETVVLEAHNMKTRIISAVVLLPILLAIVLAGPKILTAILFGAMASIGAYELLYGTGLMKNTRMLIYSMVMAFLTSIWSYFGAQHMWAQIGILVFCVVLFADMMANHVRITFDKLALCIAAGLLIPYMLTSLVRIHVMPSGRHMILIPFVLAMLSDTGAYFTGRAFGHKKLAPAISPNKTVEGVVGGVISAVLGMLLYTMILGLVFKFQVNYFYAVIYGILGAAIGVFGDLCLSVIKRQTGIKDYGNLIPGHGGILDRFDSMLFVGTLTEVLLLMIPVAVAV